MAIILGNLDLSKPTWTKIHHALVDNSANTGKCSVEAGDLVELKTEFLLEAKKWLSEEQSPYVIDHIAQWRCGRVSLYLKTKGGKDVSVGLYSHMFKSATH